MKLKVKRFGSTLIVLLLTYYTVQYLGHICKTTYCNDNVGEIKAFHSLPENTVEVLALGSSHCHRSVMPSKMYSDYGIGAFDYTCSYQKGNQTIMYLKDALLTQKPKVVLIESYLLYESDIDIGVNFRVLVAKEINSISGKIQYLREAIQDDSENYFAYFFPIAALHDRWVDLQESSFKEPSYFERYSKSFGYRGTKKVKKIKISGYDSMEQEEFSDTALKNLDEIVEICKENNIEIIFFTTPSSISYRYEDAMANYAENNNCTYIDLYKLVDEIGISGETDFFDAGHLNNSGAKKVSAYLGQYLAEHYDLTDMRTVEGNIWQQQLDK